MVAAGLCAAACGNFDGGVPIGGNGGDGGAGPGPGVPGDGGVSPTRPRCRGAGDPSSPWIELATPAISVDGGAVSSAIGRATAAGSIRLASNGGLVLAASSTPPPGPSIPAARPGGRTLVDADLVADVSAADTLRIDGDVQTGGSDATRTLTSTAGDIVVSGVLCAADLGAAGQRLVLRAPVGTVYVTGAVATTPDDGVLDGDAGGGITIQAVRIVVTGELTAAGEPGEGSAGVRGGDAGAIALTASDSVMLAGHVDSSGGDARGAADATGGNAAAVAVSGHGDVELQATVRLRGGAAEATGAGATGGAASTFAIDSDGAVVLDGAIDARGGGAAAASGAVRGGTAGVVLVGNRAPPPSLEVRVPLSLVGGAGPDAGGAGGKLSLLARGGDLVLASDIVVDGGASAHAPGAAGTVTGRGDGGAIRLAATIHGVGGAATGAATAPGGTGAVVDLEVRALTGPMIVAASGQIVADGGASSGAGRAGGGGNLRLASRDGDASMAGQLLARGGDAPGGDGTGGLGGALNLWTDTDYDGIGGNLHVETTGVIDVSGGAGAHGGSARNNGGVGVALFPEHQEQLAVLLNSETIEGAPQDGILVNLGTVIARGGARGGWGGDIMYHGRLPDGGEHPVPGQLEIAGDGDGRPGDFAAE